MDDAYQADDAQLEAVAQQFYSQDYTQEHAGLTLKRAKEIGDEIGLDWDLVDLGQFVQGIKVEMEHGTEYGSVTKVHDDSYATAGRIAYAHLIERPDYYNALEIMEQAGDVKFNESDAAKRKWVADQRIKYQEAWQTASQ